MVSKKSLENKPKFSNFLGGNAICFLNSINSEINFLIGLILILSLHWDIFGSIGIHWDQLGSFGKSYIIRSIMSLYDEHKEVI